MKPFLKEKNVKEVDGDTLIRPSLDGISFASEIPSSQQMAERNAGFMRRQKVSQKATPAWYVGTSNKIGTYSAEPKQLLRYGLAGAQHPAFPARAYVNRLSIWRVVGRLLGSHMGSPAKYNSTFL